jgi:hypothetical protein
MTAHCNEYGVHKTVSFYLMYAMTISLKSSPTIKKNMASEIMCPSRSIIILNNLAEIMIKVSELK